MKIMMLANPDSTHTRKWVSALYSRGFQIVLFSLSEFDTAFYQEMTGLKFYNAGFNRPLHTYKGKLRKVWNFLSVSRLKHIIADERPDILHAHYASSYGLLGAMCKYHPFVISVWGSDVYEFPRSSFIARRILHYSLSKADVLLSTSKAMAHETLLYSNKKKQIEVTPFGTDTAVFFPSPFKSMFDKGDLVVGTVKSLEKVYGLEFLIRAFASVVNNNSQLSLKLLMVGGGSCRAELEDLALRLGISGKVKFTGYVDHSKLPEYFNNIDIFVVPSLRESFGVSVLEASSCGVPVIASNTGGLPEVVEAGKSGILVNPADETALANAIDLLVKNPEIRTKMGNFGRNFILENYSWVRSVDIMCNIYDNICKQHKLNQS